MRTLLFTILDISEKDLKSKNLISGMPLTNEEKQLNSILNWAIFKKGLSYMQPSNFICKKNKKYELLKDVAESEAASEKHSMLKFKQKGSSVHSISMHEGL